MAGIARHLFHYASALDGQSQPYMVCAPDDVSLHPLPLVILLHDVLTEPTPGGFTEEAYREAARWLTALESSKPLLLLQPFGHGNAGWLGPGGRDLFDVLDMLGRQFSIDSHRVSLFGVGAGGTGALQLMSWFPDRFSAVAAVGAWTDPSLDLLPGQDDWPSWEKPQRMAVSPVMLAKNLRHKPVYLEHPWWLSGFSGTANPSHFAAIRKELQRSASVRWIDRDPLSLTRECPIDRTDLLQWLILPKTEPQRNLTTYSPRSGDCGPVSIERLSRKGTPAACEITGENGILRIKTRNVDALVLRGDELRTGVESVQIDKQALALELSGGQQMIERLSGTWQTTGEGEESNLALGIPRRTSWSQLLFASRLCGPVMDMRWDAVLFITGSLGGEEDNERMGQFIDELRRRWQSGADSLQPHPGNRTAALEYPTAVDVEVSDEMLAAHHVVLVGNPRTNLLFARFAAKMPVQWIGDDEGSEMQLLGKEYSDPNDAIFFLTRSPEYPGRYIFGIGVNDTAALVHAAKVQTAYLPDYFVHRAHKVLDWGYFDWSGE